MSIKSRSDATLHEKDDLDFFIRSYEEDPTEEKYQRVRRYEPQNEKERIFKPIALEQIEKDLNARKRFHELANLFPLLPLKELKELAKDIRKNGLLNEIILLGDKIVDGRNRLLACIRCGVKPKFKQLDKNIDPLTFVVSENLFRRHLNSAQKAEIGLNILEHEKKRARERQLRHLKQFKKNESEERSKHTTGSQKNTSTDGRSERATDQKTKGRAMKIVAKKMKISDNTLRKVQKIKEVAETDANIAKQWKNAKKGEISINKIYEQIVPQTPKKSSKKPTMESFLEHLDYFIDLEDMDKWAQSLARQTRTRLNLALKYKKEPLSGSSHDGSNGGNPKQSIKNKRKGG